MVSAIATPQTNNSKQVVSTDHPSVGTLFLNEHELTPAVVAVMPEGQRGAGSSTLPLLPGQTECPGGGVAGKPYCSVHTGNQVRKTVSTKDRISKGNQTGNQARKTVSTKNSISKKAPVKDWAILKEEVVKSLWDCGRKYESEKVRDCHGLYKVGQCQACGRKVAFPKSCRHRLCSYCASLRAELLIEGHSELLEKLHYPKHLTLTFLSVKKLDKAYIKWARGCFSKLRRRKVFSGCWGGLYSFEFTFSKKHGWHPHIHALLGSKYMKQVELEREWLSISGANMVDIRAVEPGQAYADKWEGIREVVKYPCKVSTFADSPELVNEFLLATEGVVLAQGFGAMYRVKGKSRGNSRYACPVCGSTDICFEGWGFEVGADRVLKVQGGYLFTG